MSTGGSDVLHAWALRASAPLIIFAANSFGVKFTSERLNKAALAVVYVTALTAASVYWRIASDDERARTVRVAPGSTAAPSAAAAVGDAETLTVRQYDTRALRQLLSSVGVVRCCARVCVCACAGLQPAAALTPSHFPLHGMCALAAAAQSLGIAWLLHASGVTSNMLTLQICARPRAAGAVPQRRAPQSAAQLTGTRVRAPPSLPPQFCCR
jgi:hypothetical protein